MVKLLIGAIALLGLASSIPLPTQDGKPDPKKNPLHELAWMAGEWRGKAGDADVVEWHSDPRGGTIVMAARELATGRPPFFDFGLITATGEKVVYTPYPAGKKGPAFELTSSDAKATKAVFANEKHDFPKRFTFARTKDTLTITLEGDEGGKPQTNVYDLKLWTGEAPAKK